MQPLRYRDRELRDLAEGSPELHDAAKGRSTGARLVRLLGVGGMAAVFLAEVDAQRRTSALAEGCPSRLAIKITKPSVMHDLSQEGVDPRKLADREADVLGSIMTRRPPTDVVVGFYGRGDVLLERDGDDDARAAPWLALELVDGGPDGTMLTDRIKRAPGGCDPVRAYGLVRRIAEGVSILHEKKVIHRDLKPDNVLVAGPVGDETPKIVDCGVARHEGATSSIAALTREYAAPEQWLSRPGKSNRLIGPWTDVHALAAVIWFIVAGEHWCRGSMDQEFLVRGDRRSVRTGARLHPGFAAERAALDALDALLGRAASPALPDHLRDVAPAFGPKGAPPRLASVEELTRELLPLLADIRQKWQARAAREGLASTVFRSTQIAPEASAAEPLAEVVEVAPIGEKAPNLVPLTPGNVAFQSNGRALARLGDRLFSLWDEEHVPVPLAPDQERSLTATSHVVRAPFDGFALVGPSHIRFVRPGRVASVPVPVRADGRSAGPIEAAVGDARAFGVVTADTGEGGPELWLLDGEGGFLEPLVLPGLRRVNAVVSSPYGYLSVGEADTAQRSRARAVFTSEHGQPTVYTRGLQDRPPLSVAVASADRLSWAAGDGFVLALDQGSVAEEEVEARGKPTAMGLDPVGVPWLVTERAVLRRSAKGQAPSWRVYYQRDAGAPALVGIGFSANGVRVVDEQGGGALLRPRDVKSWRSG